MASAGYGECGSASPLLDDSLDDNCDVSGVAPLLVISSAIHLTHRMLHQLRESKLIPGVAQLTSVEDVASM